MGGKESRIYNSETIDGEKDGGEEETCEKESARERIRSEKGCSGVHSGDDRICCVVAGSERQRLRVRSAGALSRSATKWPRIP